MATESHPLLNEELFSEQKILHCQEISAQQKRSPQKPWILLVGKSGAGKSSTINHLFNVKKLVRSEYAREGEDTSTTRETREYTITSNSKCLGSSMNLQLSIVDSPGFIGDDEGPEQDACNLHSIKEFYQTHPDFKGTYPNLIYFCFSANENRYTGKKSFVRKIILCLNDELKVIDREHFNLVVIITHCESLRATCKSDKEFRKKLDKIKNKLKTCIQNCMKGFYPDIKVVYMENKTDHLERHIKSSIDTSNIEKAIRSFQETSIDYTSTNLNIPRGNFESKERNVEIPTDDFTILSSGDVQPLNLFEHSMQTLKDNGDLYALACFNACFMEARQEITTDGHKVAANIATEKYKMTDEEKRLKKYIKKLGYELEPESTGYLDLKQKRFIESQELTNEEKIEIQKIAFTLTRKKLVEYASLRFISIECVAYFMKTKLSDKGILFLKEFLQIQHGIERQPDIERLMTSGFNIFSNGLSEEVIFESQNEENPFTGSLPQSCHFEIFEEMKCYNKTFKNKKELIRARLNELDLKMKSGCDNFQYKCLPGFNLINCQESSDIIEFRKFKITRNLEESPNLTECFKNAVLSLPDQFDKDEGISLEKYRDFFDKFGHYYVKSAYGGATITTPKIGAIKYDGGVAELPNINWTNSIMTSPRMLTNKMKLITISALVSLVEENKKVQIERALDFFKLKLMKKRTFFSRKEAGEHWFDVFLKALKKIFKFEKSNVE